MSLILENLSTKYSGADFELCKKAHDFAKVAHENQKRASGEEYFTHPCSVALILSDLGLDAKAIAAAFLHDVIEDTSVSEGDIKKEFGEEVLDLVLGVTKLEKIEFTSKEEDPVGTSEYYEKTKCQYEYDANIRLVSETVISLDDTNRQYEQELSFEYESDGGLISVHGTYRVVNEGFEGVINTELKKHNDNKISSISFISDEEAPPVGADYTYNEEGYVRRLEMHESPSTYVFNYDQNDRIVSLTYMGQ